MTKLEAIAASKTFRKDADDTPFPMGEQCKEEQAVTPTKYRSVGGCFDRQCVTPIQLLQAGEYRLYGFSKKDRHFVEIAFHGDIKARDVFTWFESDEGTKFYESVAPCPPKQQ